MWVVRAVKGRDERPAGALDRPSRPKGGECVYFSLDRADDFIDVRTPDNGKLHAAMQLALSVMKKEPPKHRAAFGVFGCNLGQSPLDRELMLQGTAYNRVRVRLNG